MFDKKLSELMNDFKNKKITINELEEDIKNIAKDEFYNQETQIAIPWSIEDIKNDRPDLTDEECLDVLHVIKEKHDANIGVNWEVLEYYTNTLYPIKK